jgi:hypothetical protein
LIRKIICYSIPALMMEHLSTPNNPARPYIDNAIAECGVVEGKSPAKHVLAEAACIHTQYQKSTGPTVEQIDEKSHLLRVSLPWSDRYPPEIPLIFPNILRIAPNSLRCCAGKFQNFDFFMDVG